MCLEKLYLYTYDPLPVLLLICSHLRLCLVPGGLIEGLDLDCPGGAGEELRVEAVAGGVVRLEPGEGDQVPCGCNMKGVSQWTL